MLRKIIRALLWYLLVATFIVYITYYDSLQGVLRFVRNIAPPLIFVFGGLLVADKYQEILYRRRIRGEVEEVIYVTYIDALKNDLLAFATAAAILAVAGLFSSNGVDFIDMIQAIVAFSAIYYVRVYYFKKIGK